MTGGEVRSIRADIININCVQGVLLRCHKLPAQGEAV